MRARSRPKLLDTQPHRHHRSTFLTPRAWPGGRAREQLCTWFERQLDDLGGASHDHPTIVDHASPWCQPVLAVGRETRHVAVLMEALPVWMEDWRPEGRLVRLNGGRALFEVYPTPTEHDEARATIAAAAPPCVRALLTIEWSGHGPEGHRQCPDCGGFEPAGVKSGDRLYYLNREDHSRDPELVGAYACSLDAALTEAGLLTQADRDLARHTIATLRLQAAREAALARANTPIE